jgi:long-chain-alcohol oxidase
VKPAQDGRTKVSYSVNDADKQGLLRGLFEIGRAYFAAGALEVHPGLHNRGTARNLQELSRLLKEDTNASAMGIYASHPMGTCRMSGTKESGVVKPTGEAWDIENLYVADASIFPTALGVNPQVTVMAAAMTLARGVLAKG